MKKKKFFIQEVIPYRKDIFICTGLISAEEILKASKELKLTKEFYKFIESKKQDIDKYIKENSAFVMVTDKCAGFIRLRDYEDSWTFWETLIHELHHYVYFLGQNNGISDEMEAQAYCQEHLFHSIRRKLQGVDKIN